MRSGTTSPPSMLGFFQNTGPTFRQPSPIGVLAAPIRRTTPALNSTHPCFDAEGHTSKAELYSMPENGSSM